MTPSSESFPKSERLKSSEMITEVFRKGYKLSDDPLTLYFKKNTDKNSPAVKSGFSVPKRKVPKAVQRNRVKRLLKEAYRLNKSELFTVLLEKDTKLFLFWVYSSAEIPAFSEIEGKIKTLLNRLIKKFENN